MPVSGRDGRALDAAKRGSILVNQLTGPAAIPPKSRPPSPQLFEASSRRLLCSGRAGRVSCQLEVLGVRPALGGRVGIQHSEEAPWISSTSQPTNRLGTRGTDPAAPIALPNCLRGRAAVFSTVGLLDWGLRRPNQSVWRMKIIAVGIWQHGLVARVIPNGQQPPCPRRRRPPGHPAL